MPPETKTLKTPTTRGLTAYDYLRHHGITDQPPTLRSSDYESCLSDPFRYYLTRRLGIYPALSWSKALNRGSWFHVMLALIDNPQQATIYCGLMAKRALELRTICFDVFYILGASGTEPGRIRLCHPKGAEETACVPSGFSGID